MTDVQPATDLVKCPFCAELIQPDAKLCKHCRSDLVKQPTEEKPVLNVGQPAKNLKGKKVCTSCGHLGNTKHFVPGSIFIEALLWLCFLIPGLIYTAWRYTAQYHGCPKCKAKTMIPADSPMASKFLPG